MTAWLAGASGLVGSALDQQWRGPGALHLLARRPLPQARHPVHVVDFAHLGRATLPPLAADDAAYCCLGTTIKVAGSQAAFRAIDHDAVLAFARAARRAGARRFAIVSALGADKRSRNFYSRVKGEVEAELATLGFTSLVIARPSLLTGDRGALGQPARAGERITQALTRPLWPLIPAAWRPIDAATVARALLRAVAQAQPGVRIVGSAELQALGG